MDSRQWILGGVLAWVAVAAPVVAQSAYLERGDNGAGIEARGAWTDEGFLGGGVSAGYSIAGTMDFGAAVDANVVSETNDDATDVQVSAVLGVQVFKQGSAFPFSLRVAGSYGLAFVSSDALDSNGEQKTGTGFSVIADLYRDLFATGPVGIRLGVTGGYRSRTYTTNSLSPQPAPSPYPIEERLTALWYGANGSLLLRTPNRRVVVAGCSLELDRSNAWRLVPALALVAPTGR